MAKPDEQDTVVQSAAGDSAADSLEDSELEARGSEEDLRALVARYEARLDEVADVVAHVRHEINNPLAGVLGQAQLLLREDLNEKAMKRARTIEELARRLRDIVGQLRQVQKTSKT
jgi:signal transduction histidine kinase